MNKLLYLTLLIISSGLSLKAMENQQPNEIRSKEAFLKEISTRMPQQQADYLLQKEITPEKYHQAVVMNLLTNRDVSAQSRMALGKKYPMTVGLLMALKKK